MPLPPRWPSASSTVESTPLQVLEDGTLLLSRRAAVMEQLGLDRQEAHAEPVAPAQVEVGSILRYPFPHGSVVILL